MSPEGSGRRRGDRVRSAWPSAVRRLARRYWDAREEFVFVGHGHRRRVPRAGRRLRQTPLPDQRLRGQPDRGGVGDVAYTLGRLLAHDDLREGRVTAVHPGITDPAAVARCFEAGVGAYANGPGPDLPPTVLPPLG